MEMVASKLLSKIPAEAFDILSGLSEDYYDKIGIPPSSKEEFLRLPTTFFRCLGCDEIIQFPSLIAHDHPESSLTPSEIHAAAQAFKFDMKTTLFVIKTVIPALSGGMEILPDTRILLRRMLFRCVVCGEGSGRQTWQQIVKDLYQHVLSGDLDDSNVGPAYSLSRRGLATKREMRILT
ncbi:hypothetical protein M422DRAFT_271437 [Sphaerobolus stellatus SS14]|uniref:Uncharacterized protein n=1 Tax=Sphaerobolus stellatus (strain SS14) TaxID=990650 RepID=A0A0C9U071_SPHS4|nr:hypothetical protein M422DRAFT_271437 [Sphaerobolus stellatus SS14]